MSPAVVVPDRAREASSARLGELAATRRRLAGGHHAELRAALGLVRLTCSEGLAADLDDLARRAGERLDSSGRDGRVRLPSWLDRETDEIRRRSVERFDATAGPAVRRVAARLCPGAAPLPLPGAVLASDPTPGERAPVGDGAASREPGPAGFRRRGAGSHGPRSGPSGDPRLLAGLAGLPVLGAGGLGWSTVLTAVGVLLLLGTLAHTRSVTAVRARLRAGTARAVAAAGVDAERVVARRLIEVERATGAALERAVADRRARIDAEIAEVRDALR